MNLFSDLRFSLHMLAKNPGFTLIAVVTLALGIGATTAIFTVVDHVLLRDLPYPDDGRLVAIWETVDRIPGQQIRVTTNSFIAWTESSTSIEEFGVFRASSMALTGQDEPLRLDGMAASRGYFNLLGVAPLHGRLFTVEEDSPGGSPVVLISESLWRRTFGADPGLVGRSITLNEAEYTVVGVLPDGLYPGWPLQSGGISFDAEHHSFWQPFQVDPASRWGHSGISGAIGRLGPAVTPTQAQAELKTIEDRLASTNNWFEGRGVELTALRNELVGEVRPALLVLLGFVGIVLLIACANVANLLLARALPRSRELAVRSALGASTGRLIRQMLIESLTLWLIGGIAGVVVAMFALDVLTSMAAADLPRAAEISLDGSVLGLTGALSLLCGVIFGLIPALRVVRGDLISSLKAGRHSSIRGKREGRTQATLVAGQVALAVLTVVCAGLLAQSFRKLTSVDVGFRAAGCATIQVGLPPSKYPEWMQVTQFFDELVTSVEALPGVQRAAFSYAHPLENNWGDGFGVQGREADDELSGGSAPLRIVSEGYFQTMGIPLKRGRGFEVTDAPERPGAVIINEALARRYFPNGDPLSQTLIIPTPSRMLNDEAIPSTFEIVGVVGNVKFTGIDQADEPAFYVPARQFPIQDMTVAALTESDPATLLAAMRDAVWAIDPELPVSETATMGSILRESVAQQRFTMLLAVLFGLVAMTLAAIGVFGTLSFVVTQRTREIGLRVALGATRGDIMRNVVGRGMLVVSIGLALGLGAAMIVSRLLSGVLFDVSPTDPATFGIVSLVIVVVTVFATVIPARRASRVDPLIALRTE